MRRTACFLLSVWILSNCVTQAFAYYHPDEGRWINRDPIEEKGGGNLCEFAGNNPLDRIDVLGKIAFPCSIDTSSNGHARRRINCGASASVAWIAKNMANMDEAEAAKWLKDEDGEGVPSDVHSKFSCPRVFSIPNKVFVYRGFLYPYDFGVPDIELFRVYAAASGWSFLGYQASYADQVTDDAAIASLKDPDIYAFIYYGHGGTMMFAYEPLPSIPAPTPFRNIAAAEVRSVVPHGLAAIHHNGCNSFDKGYDSSVSKYGEYGGYTISTSAGGGWYGWSTKAGAYTP